MQCTCKKWKTGIKEVDGVIDIARVHGINYTSGVFVFCPWCGKKLAETPLKETPVALSVGQSVRYKDDYMYHLWGNGHIVMILAVGDTLAVEFGDGESIEEVLCNMKDLRPMT